jgi:diadenosine tetraphosphate (Ap4A) HIT family hydrolase
MSLFLQLPETAWVAQNELAFAVRDKFPVTPGHTLVITRRLVPDWFSATLEEQRAVFALVDEVKRQLDEGDPRPDGYNVGFNAGEVAGQTVMHLHVHVIPRYRGDMDDPRGGVRHVIPSRGNYERVVRPAEAGRRERSAMGREAVGGAGQRRGESLNCPVRVASLEALVGHWPAALAPCFSWERRWSGERAGRVGRRQN